MGCSKKKGCGIVERIRVLTEVEPRTKEIFNEGCHMFPRRCVARDDILDALAAAVTAYRGYPDALQTLPEIPPNDDRDLPMEMVFWQPA